MWWCSVSSMARFESATVTPANTARTHRGVGSNRIGWSAKTRPSRAITTSSSSIISLLRTACCDAMLLTENGAGFPAQFQEHGLVRFGAPPGALPDHQALPGRQHGALAQVAQELNPLHDAFDHVRQIGAGLVDGDPPRGVSIRVALPTKSAPFLVCGRW